VPASFCLSEGRSKAAEHMQGEARQACFFLLSTKLALFFSACLRSSEASSSVASRKQPAVA